MWLQTTKKIIRPLQQLRLPCNMTKLHLVYRITSKIVVCVNHWFRRDELASPSVRVIIKFIPQLILEQAYPVIIYMYIPK